MRYRSKKDIWLFGPMVILLLLPFLLGISFLINPNFTEGGGWFYLIMVIALDIVILALTFPMYYEITPTILQPVEKRTCVLLFRPL